MTVYLAFGAFTILALVLLACIARGQALRIRSLEEVEACTTPVDLLAFRNLIDPSEDDYLRSMLPRALYRPLQRERAMAAIQYIWWAGKNAAVLLRIGEAAQRSPDPAVAAAGRDLSGLALHVRLHALMAIIHLTTRILIPGAIRVSVLMDRYDELRRRVAAIAGLQQPAIAGRINSWL